MKKVKFYLVVSGLFLSVSVGSVYAEELKIPEIGEDEVEITSLDVANYSLAESSSEAVYLPKKELAKVKSLQEKYKKEVTYYANDMFTEYPVFENGTYKLGKFNKEALISVEKQLNFYRNLAGLSSIPLTEKDTEFAQHGAIGLAATNQFTHYLGEYDKPADMPQSFWDIATSATESSNLHYFSGTGYWYSLNYVLDSFMEDSGSNNRQTGHRAHIMGLPITSFGVGYASNSATYSSLYPNLNYGTIDSHYSKDFVTQWPSSGYFPIQTYNKQSSTNMRWSVFFNTKEYEVGDNVSVEIKNNKTGQKMNVVDDSNGGELTAFNSDSGYYSLGGYAIVNFKPNDNFKIEKNTEYTVKVAGMLRDGRPSNYEYKIHMIDVEGEYRDEELLVKELEAYKVSSKAALKNYKNPKEYRQTQQNELIAILNEANSKIEASKDKAAVDVIVKASKNRIDKIKTNKELTEAENQLNKKELENYKITSKKALSSYKNLANYRSAQQNEIKTILNEANGKIETAKDKASIDTVLKTSKAKMDAVKTNQQLTEAEKELTAKELTNYKEKSKKILSGYKNPNDYKEEQKQELAKILSETNQKINKASSKLEVDSISKEAKIRLDKVKTNKAEGPYIEDGRFVTISKKGYSTWSNFNWKKRNESTKLLNKTYQARGKYIHNNGSTYLSLYDNQGKWQGYINEKAVKAGSGKQGAYINDGRYVTISKSNYDVWSNFSWKRKIKSKSIFNKTYQVKGRYEHFNGSTYYSLYDSKGKWQGYINSNATKMGQGKQGAYISDGRKVKVTKTNYNTWSNFNWKKRHSSKDIAGKTFIARGKYNHINGSTYYSLYDNKGKWYGYISQHAVK
ncbi:hypothetical protein [Vagococcus carniphilus]|uniref:SCP domain-containing protein n=1 Tax=Vagococcus carniphilus TaxID=218144 RepID=A0A430B6A2_9ENTE|nr:hypothetical protein [Vagococcus carniphilus]QNN72738.1 hypothetical protein H9L18_12885 [Vagococcus carniphilus]RSU15841.1 hypothetical protein CBF28_05250 [Vagococcus carniphilus]